MPSRNPPEKMQMSTPVALSRTTTETSITITVAPGEGESAVESGIPFLDHMLTTFALYAGVTLTLKAHGDLAVDQHHTVEDIGLVLGEALLKLYNSKSERARFGHAVIPMDDSLAEVALDVCNRPCVVYRPCLPQQWIGNFPTALVKEFFNALTSRARWTVHLIIRYAENSHHAVEALFKAWGVAYARASAITARAGVFSTKGTLTE